MRELLLHLDVGIIGRCLRCAVLKTPRALLIDVLKGSPARLETIKFCSKKKQRDKKGIFPISTK